MKARYKSAKVRPEGGAAMLIAIFALLLISVVAIALIVSSGTEATLAGNYRTATSAYYAGLAGLEEGRGRLSWRNPGFINNNVPNFLPLPAPTSSPPTGPTQLLYIVNPLNGETVAPLDSSNLATYPDLEYSHEFGASPDPTAPVISSTFATSAVPGPLYKWVRITPATGASVGVDLFHTGPPLSNTVLYYDPSHVDSNGVARPSFVSPPLPPTARQVIEVTALAVLPNNTQKLVQYVVYPSSLTMTFPAALTLVGNGVTYTGPDSSSFYVTGNDPTSGRTCTTPPVSPVFALGYTNPGDTVTVKNGVGSHPDLYQGYGFVAPPPPPATPSVGSVTFPANLQTVNNWESLLQTIRQNYDVFLTPTTPGTSVPGSALPSSTMMTATNPMTVFVDGDLDLTGWHQTGFGLLVVTGKFTYDPDASWEGVVLVVGKGIVVASHMGSGRIDGAMLVAQTRDSSGTVLTGPLGPTSVTYASNTGGVGIYYNSCWINAALQPTSYKILSFHEIPYP